MKVYKIDCPACGAKIDVKEDQQSLYCSYCGRKIYVDDETRHVEIKSHKIYTDEAKVKESDYKIKKLEYEEREEKRTLKTLLVIFLIVPAFIALLVFIFTSPKANEIKMPMSAASYKGENYEVVVKELKNIGFKNIEALPQKDLVTGWITSDGSVEKISINGDSDFESGAIFSKSAKVIVTYHTFKK